MSEKCFEASSEAGIYRLDTTGLFCPEPVMLLHRKVREMTTGEKVEVIATDPSSWRDIPKFCTFLEHDLLRQKKGNNSYYYLIRKGKA